MRRRYVTVREILQKKKKKKQVRSISHIYLGEKKIRKIWKVEDLREKYVENWKKNKSPIRMTL